MKLSATILLTIAFLALPACAQAPATQPASISFEQSYSGVDGDSASSTEIYGILSSLTGLPIKQGIAVTGSVNQKGEIQPIGGINEKVEGFYDVCLAKGLTGDQGVMLPRQNVQDLILRPDVIEAVRRGKFHLYPVKTVSEGISVLTGVPGGVRQANGAFTPGSVLAQADEKLRRMALTLETWTRQDKNNNEVNGKRKEKKRVKRVT